MGKFKWIIGAGLTIRSLLVVLLFLLHWYFPSGCRRAVFITHCHIMTYFVSTEPFYCRYPRNTHTKMLETHIYIQKIFFFPWSAPFLGTPDTVGSSQSENGNHIGNDELWIHHIQIILLALPTNTSERSHHSSVYSGFISATKKDQKVEEGEHSDKVPWKKHPPIPLAVDEEVYHTHHLEELTRFLS